MDHHLVRVLRKLFAGIGTPLANAALQHLERGEFSDLQKISLRAPSEYGSAEELWRDSMVRDVLRKAVLPDPGAIRRRKDRAVETFWQCERQCAETNVRLWKFLYGVVDPQDFGVVRFIDAWRENIRRILGPIPKTLQLRFSGGATYADSGIKTTIPDKMSHAPASTAGAVLLRSFYDGSAWDRAVCRDGLPSAHTIVRGNKFFTVPKDSEKDRGCCKEPALNVCLQLDVGLTLKQRLKAAGLDLWTGQEKHKRLARQASITGEDATIDMSNASDTVCRLVPRVALPEQWHELLDSLRCTHTKVGSRWVRLEKFSSMGNGFTFELETLIFSTLAITICELNGVDSSRVSCYGDDLIVPTEVVSDVLAALKFFGFTPNTKKTFTEGPFRESCGGDYFDGVPVRAHFIEELPDEPHKWIALANGLRRVCAGVPGRWEAVRGAWHECISAIPSHVRACRGPEHLGDLVIHVDEEEWRPKLRLPDPGRPSKADIRRGVGIADGHEPGHLRAWLPVTRRISLSRFRPHVQLAAGLVGVPSTGPTPRGGVTGYRVGFVPIGITAEPTLAASVPGFAFFRWVEDMSGT